MLFLSKPLKLAILDIIAVLGVASAEAIEFYKLETITKTGASVVGAHTAHGSHAWWRNSGRQNSQRRPRNRRNSRNFRTGPDRQRQTVG
jgi:hypothetical protein